MEKDIYYEEGETKKHHPVVGTNDGGFDYTPHGKEFMAIPNARSEYLVSVGMIPDGVYLLQGHTAKIERIKKGKSV